MPNSNILMYTTEDGLTKIEATFENDTVWLSIDQMAELFQRDRSVIGKHVRNIFKEGELNKESVWAKFAYTAVDGNRMNCFQMQKMILFIVLKCLRKLKIVIYPLQNVCQVVTSDQMSRFEAVEQMLREVIQIGNCEGNYDKVFE